jgi:hypothetical protein
MRLPTAASIRDTQEPGDQLGNGVATGTEFRGESGMNADVPIGELSWHSTRALLRRTYAVLR